MKKSQQEIQKLLKPLVKQCIKEVLFEEGILSTLISEVIKGTSESKLVSEQRQPTNQFETQVKQAQQQKQQQLLERRKKMMDAIGSDTYNGVNLFEGTTPAPAAQNNQAGPLSDVSPNDPGVDISSLVGAANTWKRVMGK